MKFKVSNDFCGSGSSCLTIKSINDHDKVEDYNIFYCKEESQLYFEDRGIIYYSLEELNFMTEQLKYIIENGVFKEDVSGYNALMKLEFGEILKSNRDGCLYKIVDGEIKDCVKEECINSPPKFSTKSRLLVADLLSESFTVWKGKTNES